MKKIITIIMILALIMPTFVSAESDPIVGGWYIMFDYRDMPYDDPIASGKNYMIYVLFFEENGSITGFSGESTQGIGFYGSGSTLGTWLKSGNEYTINIIGIGISHPIINNDRLIIQMTENVYYSMRRMFWGDWEKDLIVEH